MSAEPKNTGCTSARPVCAASSSRSRKQGTLVSSSTYAARIASSRSASRSASLAAKVASAAPKRVKSAVRVPRSRTEPIATIAGDIRSEMLSRTRSYRAPRRSILFTKISVGTLSRCSARINTRVCGCTPSTAEITSTAPSSTFKTRSTSAMKSGWPGVSIRLTVTSSMANDTTADLIVMPRRCSSSSESVWVVPSSTLPISSMTPAAYSSRSVSVVLPASTCAKIPKLSVVRSKRHTLRIGHKGLLDGHERCAHLRSLGRSALSPGVKQKTVVRLRGAKARQTCART